MIRYAKLKNNQLEFAPTNYNGISNWILDEKAVLAEGFLPVELHDKPNDGKNYNEEFEQFSNRIVQVWKEIVPTNEDISQMRQFAYTERTDPLTLRKLRKQALNEWTSEDEKEYVAQIKAISAQIASEFPYISEEPTL